MTIRQLPIPSRRCFRPTATFLNVTTMAFVRFLTNLTRDKGVGKFVITDRAG